MLSGFKSLRVRRLLTAGAASTGCALEGLEQRQLLSTIAWDGGVTGNGTNLLDPLNWAGDVLPAAGDDISIEATGTNPALTLSGTLAATNWNSSRAVQVNAGANLAVSGAATQSAGLTVGGTLTGGTWNMGAQNVTLTGTLAVLASPVINGTVLSSTSTQFTVADGTRFTLLRQSASSGTFKIQAGFALRDAVQIDVGATFTFQGTLANSQFTVESGGSVSALGNTTFTGGTLLNNGSITAAGTSVMTLGLATVNNGVISTTAGAANGLVTTGASFQNNGTLNIRGTGSHRIQSTTFSDAGFLNVQSELLISNTATVVWGNVNAAGISNTGAIVIDGIIDNTGSTIQMTAQLGNVYLQRGTIQGGTLSFDSGAMIKFQSTTGAQSTLRDVTITGEVLLQDRTANNALVRLMGSTTFPRMRAISCSVAFESFTLGSEIVFESANRTLTLLAGQTVSSIGPAGIVRLSADATGNLSIINPLGNAAVRNRGIVEALAPTREVILVNNWISSGEIRATGGQVRTFDENSQTPASFSNEGLISISNAGKFTFQNASWSSPGAINSSSGTLVLAGSWRSDAINLSAFSAVNTTVSVTGIVDNTDLTMTLSATTGSWQFKGATLRGGFVDASTADLLVVPTGNTTLSDVQINGTIRSTGQLTLSGSTRFTRILMLDAPSTGFAIGYTLRDEIVVSGPGTTNTNRFVGGGGSIAATGTIRFDSTATNGLWVSANGLVNHGLIVSSTATHVGFGFSGGYFINAGTIRANAGAFMNIDPTTFVNPGFLDIQGGTIQLEGSIQGSEFNGPGVTNNGGSFALNGILYNAGNFLSLPNAGSLTMLTEAQINGGTLSLAPGAAVVVAATGNAVEINDLVVLNEIIVNSRSIEFGGTSRFNAIRLRGAVSVNFPAGYTLRDNIYAEGAATGARGIGFDPGADSTIAPGVIIELSAAVGGELQVGSDSRLVNLGTIRAMPSASRLRITGSSFTNSGTIDGGGGSISIESLIWSNIGQINIPGGTFSAAGAWSSTGSINLQNATTTLGGAITTVGLNLPGLTRSGGTLAVSAAWDNSSQSVTTDMFDGAVVLSGARITGGTLTASPGATLTAFAGTTELTSTQLVGDLIVTSSGVVTIHSGTRFGTIYLRGVAQLNFDTGYVIQDRIVADGSAPGIRVIAIAAAGTLIIGSTGSVELVPATGGDLNLRATSGVTTLTNNGAFRAGGSTTFSISATNFTNNGLMAVSSGRLAFITGTMTSPGVFEVSGGTLSLGGIFNTTGFDPAHITRTGGAIELSGTFSNAGRTFTLNASTGSWAIVGAVVSAGNIVLNDGVALNISNTSIIQGAIVQGDLIVLPGASVTLQAGSRFTTLHLRGNANVDTQNGFVLLDAIVADGIETGVRTLRMTGASALQIGATGSLRLAADSGGDLTFAPTSTVALTNSGLISNDSVARLMTLRVAPLNSTGTVQAIGGAVQITGTISNISSGGINGGTWRVANGGVLAGIPAVSVNNATVILEGSGPAPTWLAALQTNFGTLTLGGARELTITPASGSFTEFGVVTLDAGSHLLVNGAYIQAESGQLSVRLAGTGAAQVGSVTSTGAATIGGSLTISFIEGYTPHKLDSFDVVVGSTVNGSFANVTLPAPLPVGKNFLLLPGDRVRFVVSSLADTNSDGVVDFFDYLDFVQLFSTSDPLADFNGDGSLDFFDYLDFIDEFSHF